jgi:hypothetical protein
MIATVFALILGGVITIATFVCLAYLLAHLQDVDKD